MTEVDIKPDGVGSSARLYTHLLGFHLEGDLEEMLAHLKTQVEARTAA